MPNNWTTEQTAAYMRNLYVKQRQNFLAFLGGAFCIKCGATESLEFDHVNPPEKSLDVGILFGKNRLSMAYAELKKCQVLCGHCHRRKTSVENSARMKAENIVRNGPDGFRHGTVYSFMKAKCECGVCVDFKQTWQSKRNSLRRISAARGPYAPRPKKPSPCPLGYSWCKGHKDYLPVKNFTSCRKSANGLDYNCAQCKAAEYQRKKTH